MDNFKIRKNQLIFNVFPSLSDAKRTQKKWALHTASSP